MWEWKCVLSRRENTSAARMLHINNETRFYLYKNNQQPIDVEKSSLRVESIGAELLSQSIGISLVDFYHFYSAMKACTLYSVHESQLQAKVHSSQRNRNLWFVQCVSSMKNSLSFVRVAVCNANRMHQQHQRNRNWLLLVMSHVPHSSHTMSRVLVHECVCVHLEISV